MSDATGSHVSTGALPSLDVVRALVDDAYDRFRPVSEGRVSRTYPALTEVDPEGFGICVVGVDGGVHARGDADVPFALMSVAKPFAFAAVCDLIGPVAARDAIGVDATGLAFDSVEAVERHPGGRTNPMVNAGAIVTAGLVPGPDPAARWETLRRFLSRFAGRDLALDEGLYRSASATNLRNRAIAHLLHSVGALAGDPAEALDRYTRQSCLSVSARDLAVMGATLADGGVNPVSGEQVVSAAACRCTLSVMATAGLYERSGDWLYEVGLPGKSGIGGGVVTVSPGKGGLGTYSPRLDPAGNSVRGRLVAAHLSSHLGLDLFTSRPARATAEE